MIELWAEKELRNLIRMKNAGNQSLQSFVVYIEYLPL